MAMKDMIKFYRERDGYSQAELARKVHVSPAAIGNYESGFRKPKPETEEALADLFNVSLDNLRGIDTEKKPPMVKPEYVEMVDKFSRLSEKQQTIILNTIDAFLLDSTQ